MVDLFMASLVWCLTLIITAVMLFKVGCCFLNSAGPDNSLEVLETCWLQTSQHFAKAFQTKSLCRFLATKPGINPTFFEFIICILAR